MLAARPLLTACTRPTRWSRNSDSDHCAQPVHAVGPATSSPAPISLRAELADSAPPNTSSTLAEVQEPRTKSVSTGWTAWPSQSPRRIEPRSPVPKAPQSRAESRADLGFDHADGLVQNGGVFQAQGPVHELCRWFHRSHGFLLMRLCPDTIAEGLHPQCASWCGSAQQVVRASRGERVVRERLRR